MEKEIINIKIKKNVYELLRKHLLHSDGDNESFCFLYCYESLSGNVKTYFPDVIVPLDVQDFSKKEKAYLKLTINKMRNVYADFIVDENHSCLIACHSHPFDTTDCPKFSSTDDDDERTQSTWFYNELSKLQSKYKKEGVQIEYLNLVMSQKGLNARKYNMKTNKFEYVDKLTVFSDKISFFFPSKKNEREPERENDTIFSRTNEAFGDGLTQIMNELTVAAIGAGGIGSIVSEGIARLGAKKLLLIDPDKVEITNLNRLQGASIDDIGKYKVDVIKTNLEKYFNKAIKIEVLKEDVKSEKVMAELKKADILIGCIDNHATRYFLNRFSVQYLIPYLDGATLIKKPDEESGNISVVARIAVVIPSITNCMDCSLINYFDPKEIYLYFAHDIMKHQREKAGYNDGDETINSPAVYPQNLAVSSFLLLELMNVIAAYKPLYNNVYLDYSNINVEKQLATSSDRRKQAKLYGCLNCDEYMGNGDNIKIFNFEKIDMTGLNDNSAISNEKNVGSGSKDSG